MPIPPELVRGLSNAHEVILCVSGGELGAALDLLQRHVAVPQRVLVIWSGADAGLLQELLDRGYQVFDGLVEGSSRLFAGRGRGYFLPELRPVPNAFDVACRDLWRRMGTYLLLGGQVSGVFPEHQLFQLQGREHFFINAAAGHLPLPELGSEVEVLAICPWASSRTVLASAQRITVRRAARLSP